MRVDHLESGGLERSKGEAISCMNGFSRVCLDRDTRA